MGVEEDVANAIGMATLALESYLELGAAGKSKGLVGQL